MKQRRYKDITNKRFGQLSVKSYFDVTAGGDALWLCKCDCGNTKTILGASLRRGATKSCGCLQKESAKEQQRNLANAHWQHGLGHDKFYKTWHGMIERTTRSGRHDSKNYFDRGVDVASDWIDFMNFKDDMYELYLVHICKHEKQNTTLERIKNELGYSKGNCRWATRIEQQRNKRTNRMVTFQGKTQCVAAWCEELSLTNSALLHRLNRGWPVEKALTTPVRGS